jgi:hypothetical protein
MSREDPRPVNNEDVEDLARALDRIAVALERVALSLNPIAMLAARELERRRRRDDGDVRATNPELFR